MESRSDSLSYRIFNRLAQSVLKHPRIWVLVWLVLFALAIPGSLNIRSVLQGANGTLPNSEAMRAQKLVKERFRFAYAQNYQIVIVSDKFTVQDAPMRQTIKTLRDAILKESDTLGVQTVYDSPEPQLMQSKDGHKTFLLVGQELRSLDELQKRTATVRDRLKPLMADLKQQQPDLNIYLTGMNAVINDIDGVASTSTSEAEKRVLLITLALLLLAFGSFTGALLPGLIAVLATIIGLGLIYLIAQLLPVSVYAQTISTMIGLAVGIDYALLMVWRLREEQSKHHDLREALRLTIIRAGKSVFFAGLTFMIGLAGLLFTGLTALFSIGLGGVTVVALSMMLSLTMLPALLLLIGPWLEFPRFLSERLTRVRPSKLWEPLSLKIMRRPIPVAIAALTLVTLLSAPATQLRIGQFDLSHLPPHLESVKGFEQLGQMSTSGIMVPIFLVVGTTDGSDILTPERLQVLRQVQREMAVHPLIERVHGVAGLGEERDSIALYNQLPFLRLAFPQLFEQFVSRDQQLTMVQLIPKRLQDNDAQVEYVAELRKTLPERLAKAGMNLQIGGPAAFTLEYNIASFEPMPAIMLGIIICTWLFLFWALRSYLIALKAILLNLCSVTISYGVVVLVFQYGILPFVPTSSIIAYVPLLLFCIIFGMSIDYEVFLMSRIKEEYDAGYDNEQATARGIRATGDVITYAALIMCIVFGAFTGVEISIIKQLGFGLATAILVDATLIRMILVPAFMKIGGKWNWYPGNKQIKNRSI